MALTKLERRHRIKKRIRKIVFGNKQKPRLSVFRSNKQIYAQLIDDSTGSTLAFASSIGKLNDPNVSKSEIALMVGKLIAEKAKIIGVESCSFDRNGYLYHGRIKALAEAAREGGLKF